MQASFLRKSMLSIITLSLAILTPGCKIQQPNATETSALKPDRPVSVVSPTFPTAPITLALSTPDAALSPIFKTFINGTSLASTLPHNQGVWIQTDTQLLANHQGTVPLSAASLTKAATSLAALQTLGPNYRFTSKVGMIGSIQDGTLQGNLVIQGGQNPFFVWEDAITLGTLLNQYGIRQIAGNLIVVGPFFMNFEGNPTTSGSFLKQGLDSALWPAEARDQFQTLPANTLKPQIAIKGTVIAQNAPPEKIKWIAQHQSFPMADLLKKMNRYSNNPMAEMMANVVGGASGVAQKAIAATGVPATEIQLVNGSGLATENRMSPRAVCALFLAIDKRLRPQGMTIADIFTVMGTDESVLDQRPLPQRSVLKSGTLDTVSALGGALPTRQGGVVWFALLNNEGNVETFRALQEKLLNTLEQTLGTATAVPPQLTPTQTTSANLTHAQLWSPLGN